MKFLEVERYTYLEEKHKPYLEKLKAYVQGSKYLPKHHIYPPCGLMNDPNGLSYFGGQYHVFYQWFPFGPSHGMKHWAHVTSKDMTEWKWSEEMLIPNLEYEKNGCYSGNALVKGDTQYLFYTANYKTENGKIPKQAVAVMDKDGHIEKYAGNPVIDGAPEGMSGEIRDPFVFEKEGRYYMLLGAKDTQEKGQLLLYSGEDVFHWEYEGVIDTGLESLGTMAECPSYLKIDGKDILVVSPIGFPRETERFQNQFPSIYLTGTLDLENRKFTPEYWDEIDAGFDFYAPQMFRGQFGEALLFGWFGCGDQSLPTDKDMWRHALTLPRELHVKENRLYANPVKAVAETFGEPLLLKEGESMMPESMTYRMDVTVSPEEKKTLVFGEDADFWTLTLNAADGVITADRSTLEQKVDPAYGEKRVCRVEPQKEMQVQIFSDNSFVELYINGGEKVMSLRTFQKSRSVCMRKGE